LSDEKFGMCLLLSRIGCPFSDISDIELRELFHSSEKINPMKSCKSPQLQ